MKTLIQRYRWLVIIILIGAVLVLAFPLQGVVQKMIIGPAMHLGWLLGTLYRAIPQFWLWGGLIVIVFLISLFSFINIPTPRWRARGQKIPEKSPIKNLAEKIKKNDEWIYTKWRLANRIGYIARDWLAYQERHEKKWHANVLEGRNWQPDKAVQQYLDAGLNGSFADFPHSRNPFHKNSPTPLDIDPNEALDYLESLMEAGNGRTPE